MGVKEADKYTNIQKYTHLYSRIWQQYDMMQYDKINV